MNIYSIYKATNTLTRKSYIGFDSSWPKRKIEHRTTAYRDTSNNKFYNAIRKHGFDSFEWEVLYQSTDGEHCLGVMEDFFILENNTIKNGYNSSRGGRGGHRFSRWWNNDILQVFSVLPPDDSYKHGRLPFNNRGSKIGSEKQKNSFWINNGEIEYMTHDVLIPPGYVKGRLSIKAFAGGAGRHDAKGTFWWNNGIIQKMSKDSPGYGFVKGRLRQVRQA